MGFLPQEAHGVVMRVGVGHDLVKDVVISLDFQLKGDAGFLQQVSLDVSRSDFQVAAEMNTNELALHGRKGEGYF